MAIGIVAVALAAGTAGAVATSTASTLRRGVTGVERSVPPVAKSRGLAQCDPGRSNPPLSSDNAPVPPPGVERAENEIGFDPPNRSNAPTLLRFEVSRARLTVGGELRHLLTALVVLCCEPAGGCCCGPSQPQSRQPPRILHAADRRDQTGAGNPHGEYPYLVTNSTSPFLTDRTTRCQLNHSRPTPDMAARPWMISLCHQGALVGEFVSDSAFRMAVYWRPAGGG